MSPVAPRQTPRGLPIAPLDEPIGCCAVPPDDAVATAVAVAVAITIELSNEDTTLGDDVVDSSKTVSIIYTFS